VEKRSLLGVVVASLAVVAVVIVALASRTSRWAGKTLPTATQVLPCPTPTAESAAPSPTKRYAEGQSYPYPSATYEPTMPATTPSIVQSPTLDRSQFRYSLHFPYVAGPESTGTPTASPAPTSTRRPKPTPTPTLPWPEPLEAPGRSKLGIHVQWNCSHDIMRFITRMKPAVVKSVGDLGFLAETKAVSPQTITMARFRQEGQTLEGDPLQVAQAFVNAHLEEYLKHPAVDYWEGYNEPSVQGKMAWYAAFEAERVRVMAQYGLRTAVGGFSTGVPEWEEFEAFLPAIKATKEHGGILTLHEYDAPLMDRSVGAGLPGHPGRPNVGPFALRYRWWYEEILKPRGLVVPLVISEAGIDGGVPNHPGPHHGGWQGFVGYWKETGLGDDGIQVYLRQLAWYDEQLQQDDYVLGFAVFTAGAMNKDWKSFDITPILRHIATYIIAPSA